MERLSRFGLTALAAMIAVPAVSFAAGLTVLTVPWVPATPTSPHTTYPINPTTEVSIILGATAPSAASGDSLNVVWNFGDGSPTTSFTTTNQWNLSTTHQYPASAAGGTQWTATVTVTDTTAGTSGSANYYVIQEAYNLQSRVNVAIDDGLWYMHETMWRVNTPGNGQTVNWGGWDGASGSPGCTTVYAPTYSENLAFDCYGTGVIDATNIQAFEVSGHQGTAAGGPATDPYTDDVTRGLARMFAFLGVATNGVNSWSTSNKYLYNPATVNYGCSDGTAPLTTGACGGAATKVFYNASSTTCTSPPCTFVFDANSNNQSIYSNDNSGEPIYTGGPFVDALVATGTPTGTAPTGVAGVIGNTYATIVTDMLDYYGVCQYENDEDPGNPAFSGSTTRGAGYSASGGGWLYTCQEGDDNSTSQWAAISFVSGLRGSGFGFNAAAQAYFKVVQDYNNVWVTNSQDVQDNAPTAANPYNTTGDNRGAFGYRGSLYYSNAWGPFAVTPSGMVQMAMDGIGRTTNTAYGDASNAPDQRWNDAETFYADNFCNGETTATDNPKYYTYGMLSFTKSMLLHDPGGVLSPIQYLRTKTPNVFTGDSSVPANTIDWYAALSAANGGSDPCDGVAQTLVSYQDPTGYWYNHDYDEGYQSDQSPFETAWSIIMLQKTVFVACVNNLAGAGKASSRSSGAEVTLSWTGIAGASSYQVLRGTANGGPYANVGSPTTGNAFVDQTAGLVNGDTYYYVIDPLNSNGGSVCQSNQATIKIP